MNLISIILTRNVRKPGNLAAFLNPRLRFGLGGSKPNQTFGTMVGVWLCFMGGWWSFHLSKIQQMSRIEVVGCDKT